MLNILLGIVFILVSSGVILSFGFDGLLIVAVGVFAWTIWMSRRDRAEGERHRRSLEDRGDP